MPSTQVQRTLVKSPPELWAELSDPASLARHLGELGEIRITRVEPEHRVDWEAERASGSVVLKPSGWGTKVTISAEAGAGDPDEPSGAVGERGAAQTEPGIEPGGAVGEPPTTDAVTLLATAEPLTAAKRDPSAAALAHADEPAGIGVAPEPAAIEPAPVGVAPDTKAVQAEPPRAAAEPAEHLPQRHPRLPTLWNLEAEKGLEPRRVLFARIARWFRGGDTEHAHGHVTADSASPADRDVPAEELAVGAEAPAPLRAHTTGPPQAHTPGPQPPDSAAHGGGTAGGQPLEAHRSGATPLAPQPQPPGPPPPPQPPDPQPPAPPQPGPRPIDVVPHDVGHLRADAEADVRAAEQCPRPASQPGFRPEPAPADEMTALLTSVLDRLGAAHHRPFSRA